MRSCSYDPCKNVGGWQPVLELRSRRDGPVTKLWFSTLIFCEDHRRSSALDSFLSPEGFDKICRHMKEAGKKPPVRKLITLIWEPIEETTEDIEAPTKLNYADPAEENLAF